MNERALMRALLRIFFHEGQLYGFSGSSSPSHHTRFSSSLGSDAFCTRAACFSGSRVAVAGSGGELEEEEEDEEEEPVSLEM